MPKCEWAPAVPMTSSTPGQHRAGNLQCMRQDVIAARPHMLLHPNPYYDDDDDYAHDDEDDEDDDISTKP